jgi:nickel/cobalt transporter (NicO) family protein
MAIGAGITVAAVATSRRRQVESHSGYGTLALRGIEVGAAVVIIAFGTLLLAGYIVTERMVGI